MTSAESLNTEDFLPLFNFLDFSQLREVLGIHGPAQAVLVKHMKTGKLG